DKVEALNQALVNEYEVRRKMLLKRLDVTVQSFGWSERAKNHAERMKKVYHPLRAALSFHSKVSVGHLFAAREDLSKIHRTSSGKIREKTACAINKVLMGRVPDRGGRPCEIQAPPPEMPSWQKRQDGPQGGGGSYGGGAGTEAVGEEGGATTKVTIKMAVSRVVAPEEAMEEEEEEEATKEATRSLPTKEERAVTTTTTNTKMEAGTRREAVAGVDEEEEEISQSTGQSTGTRAPYRDNDNNIIANAVVLLATPIMGSTTLGKAAPFNLLLEECIQAFDENGELKSSHLPRTLLLMHRWYLTSTELAGKLIMIYPFLKTFRNQTASPVSKTGIVTASAGS
ncbi:unnamed protein product, partial [Gadus morhua 'NCC']